jgi:hypothetical protein
VNEEHLNYFQSPWRAASKKKFGEKTTHES